MYLYLILCLGTLAKYTAGQVYYYPAFQSAIHGEKLRHELRRDLTRETAWEAVMRIRCAKGLCIHYVLKILAFYVSFCVSVVSCNMNSQLLIIAMLIGVRFTTYHGNFMLRSTDLLALPAVDCDKAFAMQLSLEETLLTTQTMYFQVALLYPSIIHEHNLLLIIAFNHWNIVQLFAPPSGNDYLCLRCCL